MSTSPRPECFDQSSALEDLVALSHATCDLSEAIYYAMFTGKMGPLCIRMYTRDLL